MQVSTCPKAISPHPRRPGARMPTCAVLPHLLGPAPHSEQVLLHFLLQEGPSPCLLEPQARAGLILFARLTVSLPARLWEQGSCLNFFFNGDKIHLT